jgi:hypothetical protein
MGPQAADRRARNRHRPYLPVPRAILAFAAACPAFLSPAGLADVPLAGGMVRFSLPGAGVVGRRRAGAGVM